MDDKTASPSKLSTKEVILKGQPQCDWLLPLTAMEKTNHIVECNFYKINREVRHYLLLNST